MALRRDDDYATVGKPPCDWDDAEAREQLVDALVVDALAALAVLDGCLLDRAGRDAAELLALIAGQDVEEGDDGVFRIARRVATDRIISTVDPEARHGHKSHDRRFDGYKAHLSVDPDSELIDDVIVTPATTHDAEPAADLLAESVNDDDDQNVADKPIVFGDSAYAGADTLDDLGQAGFDVRAKVPPARGRDGRFGKDDFDLDLEQGTVGCPAGHVAPIRPTPHGGGRADFAPTARPARCATNARRLNRAAQSPSTPKRHYSSGTRPLRTTPDGSRRTVALGPRWNAKSPTSAGRMGRPQGAHPRTTKSVDRR